MTKSNSALVSTQPVSLVLLFKYAFQVYICMDTYIHKYILSNLPVNFSWLLPKVLPFAVAGFSGQKQPPEMFYKKFVHRNLTKFIGKHLQWSLFINKFPCPRPATSIIKTETPTQAFSCVFCETFKNAYFVEHLQTVIFF